MLRSILSGKIHRATVTEANLNYKGSLTLDPDVYEAAGMMEHERVLVVNINTGGRFETYIIDGERGSGVVCLNGAAARHGQPGDLIIIMTFALMDTDEARQFRAARVLVDEHNRVTTVDS